MVLLIGLSIVGACFKMRTVDSYEIINQMHAILITVIIFLMDNYASLNKIFQASHFYV